MKEDVWRLGLSPSDPLIDHVGLRTARAYQGRQRFMGLVWGFDKYLCKVMQGKQPWTYYHCRIPVNYFKMRGAIKTREK